MAKDPELSVISARKTSGRLETPKIALIYRFLRSLIEEKPKHASVNLNIWLRNQMILLN
jgi:hypothetical protein